MRVNILNEDLKEDCKPTWRGMNWLWDPMGADGIG